MFGCAASKPTRSSWPRASVSSMSRRTRTPRRAARSIALINSWPLSSSLKMKYWMSSVRSRAVGHLQAQRQRVAAACEQRKPESPGWAFARGSTLRPSAVFSGRASAVDSTWVVRAGRHRRARRAAARRTARRARWRASSGTDQNHATQPLPGQTPRRIVFFVPGFRPAMADYAIGARPLFRRRRPTAYRPGRACITLTLFRRGAVGTGVRLSMKIGMITDSLPETDFDTMLGGGRAARDGHARIRLRQLVDARRTSTLDGMLAKRAGAPRFPRPARRSRHRDQRAQLLRQSSASGRRGPPPRRSDAQDDRLARLLDVDRVVMMSGCPGRTGRQPRELDHDGVAARGSRDPALAMGRRADSLLARPRRLCAAIRAWTGCASSCTATRTSTTSRRSAAARRRGRDGRRQSRSQPSDVDGRRSARRGARARRRRLLRPRQGHADRPGVSPASTASSTRRPAARTSRARGTTSRSGTVTTRAWWRAFVATLADVGYDGVLSIEHEDPAMSAVEGVERVGRAAAPRDRRPAAARACCPPDAAPSRGAASSCSISAACCCSGIRAICIASSSPATTSDGGISSATSAPRNGTSGRMRAARSPRRLPSFFPRMPTRRDLIEAFGRRFDEMIPGAIDGTVDILRELKRAGVPLYALTNWSAETFPSQRDRFDFLSMFDGIVVSGEEGVIKPDPRIFRILLERYGIAADAAVFIDDNPANAAAAATLGIHGIHFRSPEHLRTRARSARPPRRAIAMTVSLGINPITWTNDDMPELGGDMPLETCLSRDARRRLRRHRARRQVSARGRRAAADPRRATGSSSSPAGTTGGCCRARRPKRRSTPCAAPRAAARHGLPGAWSIAEATAAPRQIRGRRSPRARGSPTADWPALRRKLDRARRADGERGVGWRSTTTWARSSRPTPKSTC